MLASLPTKFEKDQSDTDKCVIRMKKRFKWDIHTDIEERGYYVIIIKMRESIFTISTVPVNYGI